MRTARLGGYRGKVFDLLGRAAGLKIPDYDPGELRREASASLGDFAGLEPTVITGLTVRPGPYPRLALHPRSEWLAVGLADGTVLFLDLATGREQARTPGSDSPVTALAPTPDGRLLVGHANGAIRVVEHEPRLTTPRTTLQPKAGGQVYGFFPVTGGRTLVAAGGPKAMTIRDFDGSRAITLDFAHSVEHRPGGTLANGDTNLVISPDGRLAATGLQFTDRPGGLNAELVIWELAAPRRVRHASLRFLSGLYKLAFSPDSTRLAVGGDLGFAVLDVADLTPRFTVSLDSVSALAFGPDGKTLAIGTATRLVKLWSLKTNRELAELRHGGSTWLYQMVLSADGRTLASGGGDSVQVWNLAGADERIKLSGHAMGITSVGFSPDGAMLASTSKDGTVKLWETASGRLHHSLGGYPGDVQASPFSPDGTLLATGSFERGRLRIWETRSWQEVYCATDSTTESVDEILIGGLAFGRGADIGLLATSGRGLRIWWVRQTAEGRPSLRPIAELPGSRCLHVALSPDGARAAYVDRDHGSIKLWDVAQYRELPFSGPRLLHGWHSLAFRSPRELVYIASDRAAVVWDVIADRLTRTVGQPGTFEGDHVAVSSDGRWLAAEATPSSVAIVDLERAEVVFTFREELSPIWSLAWSPDARRLAVGLSDGGLVLWDLEQVRARLAESGIDAPSTAAHQEVPQLARPVPALDLELVATLHHVQHDLEGQAAAIPLLEQALKLAESKVGPDHPTTLATRNRLAQAYGSAGRSSEAVALFEATLRLQAAKLGTDHPDTIASVHNLAHVLEASRAAESEPLFRRALDGYRKQQGPDGQLTRHLTGDLAGLFDRTGRSAEAEPLLRELLDRQRAKLPADDPALAGNLAMLGKNLLNQRKWAEAEPVLRECLAIRQKALPDDWSRFNTLSMLGGSLVGQKKYSEAEPLLLSGFEGMKAREAKIPPQGKPRLAEASGRVVELYETLGQPEKAAEWRKKLDFKSTELPSNVFAR